MAATLIQYPDNIAFNRNDMIVVLETDKLESTNGHIILSLLDSAGPVEDNSILIAFSGNARIFAFKDNPAANNEIPTKGINQNNQEYMATVANFFRQHADVSPNFEVIETNTQVRLNWLSSTPTSLSAAGTLDNMSIEAHQAAVTTVEPFFSAWIGVYDAVSNALLIKRTGVYNIATKQCLFYINDAFEHLTPTLPNPAATLVTPAASILQKYYIQYADRYGLPPVNETLQTSPDLIALRGGTSSGNRNPFFLGQILAMHDTLDVAKPVSPEQPDWLYFFSKTNIPDLFWDVVLLLSDGSTMIYGIDEFFTLEAGIPKYMRTGFKQLNLHQITLPDETYIAEYTVRIREMSQGIRVLRHYQVDPQPFHPWNLYLLYDTGLGGMETVRLKGKKTLKYESNNVIYEKYTGEFAPAFTEGNTRIEVSTGFYPLEYILKLRQLLLGDSYLVQLSANSLTPNNIQFKAIIPDTKTFDIIPDDNDLHALVFAFRMAKPDRQFNRF